MNFLLTLVLVAGLGIDSLAPSTPVGVASPALSDLQTPEHSATLDDLARRVDSMSSGQQLGEYFGPTPSASRHGSPAGAARAYSMDRFRADPALEGFDAIETSWLVDGLDARRLDDRDPRSSRLVELKVLVARNLYLRGERTVTADKIRREMARLREARSRYEDVLLFRGRSVVFAASDDTLRDGRPQFGRLATRAAIRRDAAEFYFYRGRERQGPTDRVPDYEDVVRSAPNLTFVFEGHGRESALKLDGKLTAKKLARLLSDRSSALPPAIVILDACRSHDFARHLLDEVRRLGGTVPIVVVPDEFGQSLVKDVFQAGFLRRDLGAFDDASLGSALRSRHARLSVYVPDEQQLPMQIG